LTLRVNIADIDPATCRVSFDLLVRILD